MMTSQTYTAVLGQLDATRVTVKGYLYQVDFGLQVKSRYHTVDRQQTCTCGLGTSCPAVLAVIEYLAEGGMEAPEPPEGYFPLAPHDCPVCGSPAHFNQQLCHRKRGAGWICSRGGAGHYWNYHFSILAERIKANPWLFPPVTAPDVTVLYPGLLRSDVMSTSEPVA